MVPNRIGLITLACRDVERMTRFFRDLGWPAHAALQRVDGAELLEEPTEAFWGGGFSWRDPDGNLWDVAWAKDAVIDDRGGVRFP